MVIEKIHGSAVTPQGPGRFGGWVVTENLKGGTAFFREYLAYDEDCREAGTVRLRVYEADPYLPQDQRTAQAAEIATAYAALGRLPSHECIVNERDFFGGEEGDRYVLVLDEVQGTTLGALLGEVAANISFQQRIAIMRDILSGLRHVHEHGVVHRNLTPSAVIVDKGCRARITDFDFARFGSPVRARRGERRPTPVEKECLAPEVRSDIAAASSAADVYAAGVIISKLIAGGFPGCPALLPPKIQHPLRAWLRRMTAADPAHRPSVAEAMDQLAETCVLQ